MIAILDILTVIIIVLTIMSAAKKGFLKTVIDFFSTIVSFIIALIFSKSVAMSLSSKYIAPFFEKAVGKGLENFMTTSAGNSEIFAEQFTQLFENAPEALTGMLQKFSVEASEVINAFTLAPNLEEAKTAAISAICEPISATFSMAAAFMLLFIGTLIIIKIGTFVVDSVANLPVLKQINGFLGIGIGAVQGILFVFILTALVAFLAPTIQNYTGQIINEETINHSLIFKYFYNISPMKNLLL